MLLKTVAGQQEISDIWLDKQHLRTAETLPSESPDRMAALSKAVATVTYTTGISSLPRAAAQIVPMALRIRLPFPTPGAGLGFDPFSRRPDSQQGRI